MTENRVHVAFIKGAAGLRYNRGVDTVDLGIRRKLGAPPARLRNRGWRLNVGETLLVVGGLSGESRHICARLLVIRLQDFSLLLCRRERALQLRDLVLKRRGVETARRPSSPARSA
ncbi:hypothetical protein [Bradyrhizobium monzae]|uniref:hypothetical protein n=1 Tax=Bradyrhizobium sp. Oc8 TaxID=2876780 RepID=UPI001F486320|nr:hypothetical protein [Bradyrhizobium sp. Oc8]